MKIEEGKTKTLRVRFGWLKVGSNFTFKGKLFVKIHAYKGMAALNLYSSRLYSFSSDDIVERVKVDPITWSRL